MVIVDNCNDFLEERGRVVETEGDYVWVEVTRRPGCSGCENKNECGTAVLAKTMSSKPVHIKILNTILAKPGDDVIVAIEQKSLTTGSFSVYMVPLLLMLSGALLGDVLGQRFLMEYHDGVAIIAAFAGLAGGFFWLRRYTRKNIQNKLYQPSLVRFV